MHVIIIKKKSSVDIRSGARTPVPEQVEGGEQLVQWRVRERGSQLPPSSLLCNECQRTRVQIYVHSTQKCFIYTYEIEYIISLYHTKRMLGILFRTCYMTLWYLTATDSPVCCFTAITVCCYSLIIDYCVSTCIFT